MNRREEKAKVYSKVKAGNMPRFLCAVQPLDYRVGKGKARHRDIFHFVEWHSGVASTLMKERSHTQVCLYLDLGTVSATMNALEVTRTTKVVRRRFGFWPSAVVCSEP